MSVFSLSTYVDAYENSQNTSDSQEAGMSSGAQSVVDLGTCAVV